MDRDFQSRETQPPAAGRRFGKYVLLGELGRGGMGVVYRARQHGLDRVVALKTLPPSAGAMPEARQRFLREARACGKLKHPNIVAVHEVGEAEGLPYFAMEYVEGASLDRTLRQGPPSPAKAAAWIRDLARALECAHAQGVLHRDLKPANVILDGRGLPRLTDFGLAKDASSQTLLTQAGEVFGTPAYMAPEQAEGRMAEVDARTDVYALGAMLYEMLAGRLPFEGASISEVLYKVVHEEPSSPRVLRPSADPELEAVCLKAMEKEPGRRYASAAELAGDPDRFLAGEPVSVRPPSTLGRLLRSARRNHRSVRAAGWGLLTAAVLGTGLYLGVLRTTPLARAARELEDQDPGVRRGAVASLGAGFTRKAFQGKAEVEALELLSKAAGDLDLEVSRPAFETIGKLAEDPQYAGHLKSSPALADALHRWTCYPRPGISATAIHCAQKLKAQAIVEELLSSLMRYDGETRHAALGALGLLADPAASPRLVAFGLREPRYAEAVSAALDGICTRGGAPALPPMARARDLTGLLDAAVSLEPEGLSVAAAWYASRVDVAGAVKGLADRSRSGSGEEKTRARAAHALAALGKTDS